MNQPTASHTLSAVDKRSNHAFVHACEELCMNVTWSEDQFPCLHSDRLGLFHLPGRKLIVGDWGEPFVI